MNSVDVAACLTKAYQARLDRLDADAPGTLALCLRVVDRYVKFLHQPASTSSAVKNPAVYPQVGPWGLPLASNSANRNSAMYPLERFYNTHESGVSISNESVKLGAGGFGSSRVGAEEALLRWAQRSNPPIRISPEVLTALADDAPYSEVTLDHLPNLAVYVAATIAGTALCHYDAYFQVENGVALPIAGPEFNADCGSTRFFGSLDGDPAAFEDASSYGPDLTDSLSISRWAGGRFGSSCTITLRYAPDFDVEPLNARCEGPSCPALAQVARKWAEAVQAGPQKALNQSRNALSQRQRDAFDALQKSEKGDYSGDPANYKPENISYGVPLALPVLIDDALYRAKLGHAGLGWRIYADWIVTFEKVEDGQAEHAATFRIAMTKGGLLNAKVEVIQWVEVPPK